MKVRKYAVLNLILILCITLQSTILTGSNLGIENNIWWKAKVNKKNLDFGSLMEREVVVAVIDSGIDFKHSELLESQWFNEIEVSGQKGIDDDNNGFIDDFSGWDFVGNDNFTGYDTNDPIFYHGTFITGIITSKSLGLGLNVKIIPIRILNSENIIDIGSWNDLAKAIDYAVEMGAEVINFSAMITSNETVVYNAIQNAYEKDIWLVTVSGNSSPLIGGIDSIVFPGRLNNTLCIGATNYYDERADYSNYGKEIDFVAPVGDYFTSSSKKINSTSINNDYVVDVGTSYAVPQVVGTIALLKGIDANLTNQEIYNIIKDTVTDLGDEEWDKQFGYGVINIDKAVDLLMNGIIENGNKTNLNLLISVATLVLISEKKRKKKCGKIDTLNIKFTDLV